MNTYYFILVQPFCDPLSYAAQSYVLDNKRFATYEEAEAYKAANKSKVRAQLLIIETED
jgi:hypothetical protein